jgi:outer membrane protein assembly factor BamB
MSMHIKAICPRCESSYQVDPSLKGKRMRCPNPICRAVFEVRDPADVPVAAPAAPPPPAAPARSGSVGDVVPMVAAEAAPPPVAAPRPPVEPPAVSAPAATQPSAVDDFFAGASPVSVDTTAPLPPDGPRFDGWADLPPVRQGQSSPAAAPESNGAVSTYAPLEHPGEAPPRRHGRWLLAVAVILIAGMTGGVLWLLQAGAPSDEVQRAAAADKAYDGRDFGEAANLFSSLAKDFPDSEQRARYLFLAELSAVRDPIHRTQTDKDETLGHLKRFSDFLEVYKTDPQIEKRYADIAESLYKLVEELTGFAAKAKDRDLVEQARRLNVAAAKYKMAPPAQAKAINESLHLAQQQIVAAETRQALMDRLTKAVKEPTLDAVEHARDWAQQAGLADDAEVVSLISKLPAAHQGAIVFQAEADASAVTALAEDRPPSMAFLQYRGQRPTPAPSSGVRPVLVLVRGVLYALEPGTGQVRWIRRVGIDTTELPLWLPATPARPATVLVCAAGVGGLMALDAGDGSLRWAQMLPEPCTGKPALLGDRAFVACRGGSVFEIETNGGRRLGAYDLGQPLTHGGIHHPGTNLVYFAADRMCVYALDVGARRCVGILYTGHASGSLRCPPVLLPLARGPVADPSRQGPERALLLLCQDNGSGGTQLSTYALPLGDTPPVAQPLGDLLVGRVTFAPLVNPEQVAVVTDAGAVAIFGLKQRDNNDPDIFPLLCDSLPGREGGSGPALVLHADSQGFWVLARGRLHQIQITQSASAGWQLLPRPLPLAPVGAALQDAQVVVDDLGTGLYVVTESPDGLSCWVTAVDTDSRAVRWQRQVGMVGHGQAVAIDGKVLLPDRSGNLLLFDPQKTTSLVGGQWLRGGKVAVTGLADAPGSWSILPDADAKTALVLGSSGQEIRLWKYQDGGTVPLGPAHTLDAIAGTPARLGETVLLPLANGRLARVSAAGAAELEPWRTPLADKQATGHVLALAAAKVATTDGSQGLMLWRFDGKELQGLRESKFKARILAVAALPGPGEDVRLCVADAGRTVTLLQGDALQRTRSWTLSGNITAGPVVRAGMILVVVDNRRLVWIDPERDQLPGLAFSFPADIVGLPELIDGVLVVADETGHIQGFDPRTARKVGDGYLLRADVAPAGAPLPFGDRVFVPLTDGTALLPSKLWFLPRLW